MKLWRFRKWSIQKQRTMKFPVRWFMVNKQTFIVEVRFSSDLFFLKRSISDERYPRSTKRFDHRSTCSTTKTIEFIEFFGWWVRKKLPINIFHLKVSRVSIDSDEFFEDPAGHISPNQFQTISNTMIQVNEHQWHGILNIQLVFV